MGGAPGTSTHGCRDVKAQQCFTSTTVSHVTSPWDNVCSACSVVAAGDGGVEAMVRLVLGCSTGPRLRAISSAKSVKLDDPSGCISGTQQSEQQGEQQGGRGWRNNSRKSATRRLNDRPNGARRRLNQAAREARPPSGHAGGRLGGYVIGRAGLGQPRAQSREQGGRWQGGAANC